MNIPYSEILAVVRKPGDPVAAFNALREIGSARMKSPLWESIQTPDIEADILLAGARLKESITDYQPTGVYLGLDTLNERGGTGKNVEIGMTIKADPGPLEMEWAWKCERYKEDHLIEGMYEVHRTCLEFELEYPASLLADYLFFFGYSGVVLASALERIAVGWDALFVWGFHDGDLGFLARSSPQGITRLATIEGV